MTSEERTTRVNTDTLDMPTDPQPRPSHRPRTIAIAMVTVLAAAAAIAIAATSTHHGKTHKTNASLAATTTPTVTGDGWSLAVRASTTDKTLTCEDLTRAGAIAYTKEGQSPLTVPSCDSTSPSTFSYHWAYVDNGTNNVIVFGLVPEDTTAVAGTEADGSRVAGTITPLPTLNTAVWSAVLPTLPTSLTANTTAHGSADLIALLSHPCGGDVLALTGKTPCPNAVTTTP